MKDENGTIVLNIPEKTNEFKIIIKKSKNHTHGSEPPPEAKELIENMLEEIKCNKGEFILHIGRQRHATPHTRGIKIISFDEKVNSILITIQGAGNNSRREYQMNLPKHLSSKDIFNAIKENYKENESKDDIPISAKIFVKDKKNIITALLAIAAKPKNQQDLISRHDCSDAILSILPEKTSYQAAGKILLYLVKNYYLGKITENTNEIKYYKILKKGRYLIKKEGETKNKIDETETFNEVACKTALPQEIIEKPQITDVFLDDSSDKNNGLKTIENENAKLRSSLKDVLIQFSFLKKQVTKIEEKLENNLMDKQEETFLLSALQNEVGEIKDKITEMNDWEKSLFLIKKLVLLQNEKRSIEKRENELIAEINNF